MNERYKKKRNEGKNTEEENKNNLHVTTDLNSFLNISSCSGMRSLSRSARIVMERVWLLGEQKGLWKKKGAILKGSKNL